MCLAIPGRIERIDTPQAELRCGMVSFGGIRKSINLAFVPEAEPGDYVIVHAGCAIARINEQEAQQALELLSESPSPPALKP